jgi:hypothetical protein
VTKDQNFLCAKAIIKQTHESMKISIITIVLLTIFFVSLQACRTDRRVLNDKERLNYDKRLRAMDSQKLDADKRQLELDKQDPSKSNKDIKFDKRNIHSDRKIKRMDRRNVRDDRREIRND